MSTKNPNPSILTSRTATRTVAGTPSRQLPHDNGWRQRVGPITPADEENSSSSSSSSSQPRPIVAVSSMFVALGVMSVTTIELLAHLPFL
ncbi:hypothetical protein ACFVAJ_17790 [Agromyces sp. NPDC057679]|uniref:hypothetical protein n=1 Tax=Agromyces sp. NPDC057679 TaxID=3346207 RepID=UPI00366E36B8